MNTPTTPVSAAQAAHDAYYHPTHPLVLFDDAGPVERALWESVANAVRDADQRRSDEADKIALDAVAAFLAGPRNMTTPESTGLMPVIRNQLAKCGISPPYKICNLRG
jgi:hypothetical protein